MVLYGLLMTLRLVDDDAINPIAFLGVFSHSFPISIPLHGWKYTDKPKGTYNCICTKMLSSRTIIILSVLVLIDATEAFLPASSPTLPTSTKSLFRLQHLRNSVEGEDEASPPTSSSTSETSKPSLEEKMKSWEATEEEIKAASLGGVVPGRSDAFDVGLYIAFPLMVISGLLFAFFPLIMGNIDTSDIGPPPTI